MNAREISFNDGIKISCSWLAWRTHEGLNKQSSSQGKPMPCPPRKCQHEENADSFPKTRATASVSVLHRSRVLTCPLK